MSTSESSIVAEMLHSTGKLAKEDIHLKTDDLRRKVEDIKIEVLESLKNHYINFSTQYVKLDSYIDNLSDITEEYENLCNQIEKEIKPQMKNSVAEFNNILEDIKRIKNLKSIALKVSLLHHDLVSAKIAMSATSNLSAANHILSFENVLKNIEPTHQKDIDIILALRSEYLVNKESFIYHLENAWHDKININMSLENKKSISIMINKIVGKEIDVQLLCALKLLNQLKPMLRVFGNKLLNIITEYVLVKTSTVKVSEDTSSLTITIIKDHNPELSEVFENLTSIFEFLGEEFFNLPTESEESESTLSAMNELGIVIGEELCNLIIEKSLKTAVPKRSKDLEAFRKDIVAAETFCNALQQIGLIGNNNKLLSFIYDVDALPVNKMAQDILSRARNLIQNSLHQTVDIGVEQTSVIEIENSTDIKEITTAKKNFNKSLFAFPHCQISESMKDLIKLLHEVKDESKDIGPSHSPRLYYIMRKVCELYCSVVLIYHKEEITNIPQQTAIFHNNCMYLAHCLGTLGFHYECDVQLQIKLTFLDLVHEIRRLGVEAFLAQMRHQKQQLLQLLQEQLVYGSMMDDGVVSQAEKAIRQCLYQMHLLKKVWSDILPSEVYFKSIGTLLNTCLEEIILKILSIEDIAADVAAQFDSIFETLLKQSIDLFKVGTLDRSNEVHCCVKLWYKFQELQLVLSASMQEIVDRWSSGKGPLASHFTPEEIKHLIRALFQNTERRAAALAKIR